jgi:hypothetical protein
LAAVVLVNVSIPRAADEASYMFALVHGRRQHLGDHASVIRGGGGGGGGAWIRKFYEAIAQRDMRRLEMRQEKERETE